VRSYLLGFREQSSFNHAFRGWFGTTPAAWRARRGAS
jgi:AraC-like DNA-binding protein